MPTLVSNPRKEKEIIWELEGDLPSLSSIAAIELDNLILKKSKDLEGVKRLAAKISNSLSMTSNDPTAMVVMDMAMTDSQLSGHLETVDELVQKAEEIIQRLKQIMAKPKKTNITELKIMRNFCITLSKHASAHEPSPYDIEPYHPFRR
jgi:hypothetical protein